VDGRWVFAHNGTVARYKRSRAVREALLAALSPERRARLRGETDSERCFQLFLTRLDLRGAAARPSLEDVRAAMSETVALVCAIADRGEHRSTLNFLASDGRLLCACRHGKPLQLSLPRPGRALVALASEPIGRSGWEPVPEGGFVGVDRRLRVLRGTLGVSARPAPASRAGPAPAPARRASPPAR
jgi:glutamine amidotransferase